MSAERALRLFETDSELEYEEGLKSVLFERLYETAFIEGEGIGTAYEYFVKSRCLKQLFKFNVRNVLVLGLPEKYGTSMDFVLLADQQNCNLTIVDDRDNSLEKCRDVLHVLKERGFISTYPNIISVDNLLRFQSRQCFDLVLSCEVLQRLHEDDRSRYITNALGVARYAAIFTPNKENGSHAKISKLNAMRLSELRDLFSKYQIIDAGCLDLPPFPPGLKMNRHNRSRGTHNAPADKIVMRVLDEWSRLEKLPEILKIRNSHIVFVIAANVARHDNPPRHHVTLGIS
jgi:hypothetical protein